MKRRCFVVAAVMVSALWTVQAVAQTAIRTDDNTAHLFALLAELPLPCNVPILDTLTDPAENRLFAFNAIDGEYVTVTVISPDGAFSPSWRLVDGLGVPAAPCG